MKTFNDIDFIKYKNDFITKLGDTNTWPEIPGVCGPGYPRNSIFISEALVVYSLCQEFNIDLLIGIVNIMVILYYMYRISKII
jgi:hypothetical protein